MQHYSQPYRLRRVCLSLIALVAVLLSIGLPRLAAARPTSAPTDPRLIPTVQWGRTGAATTEFSYTGAAVTIPDNSAAGVNIPLTVSGFGGGITDLNFKLGGSACDVAETSTTVGINHSWVGDLTLKLTAPSGQTVELFSRAGPEPNGSSGNNFCQTVLDDQSTGPSITTIADTETPSPPLGPPFSGSFTPENPLAAFNGVYPNGTWILNVSDNADQDTGAVRAFSLIVAAPTFVAAAAQSVNETAGLVQVSAGLSEPAAQPVSVPFTVSGSATNPADHNLASGTITIPTGQTLGTVSFSVVSDAVTDPNETVILTMGTPTNATPGAITTHTVTIAEGGNSAPDATTTSVLNVERGGSAAGNVATVSDPQTAPGALTVAVAGAPAGMTVVVTNTNGVVAAGVTCACTVAPGDYQLTLTVRDPGNLSDTTLFTVRVAEATPQQLVADSGFEAGFANSAWDSSSTNFGTVLCDTSCGIGPTAAPRTGDFWAWFGTATNGGPEDGYISQTLTIPARAAVLKFYLWVGSHSGAGAADYLTVSIDSTELLRVTDSNTTYDSGYQLVTIAVPAQFQGGNHVLRFVGHTGGTGVFNIHVDDVTVTAEADCQTAQEWLVYLPMLRKP